jgi:hypothetical protein
MYFVGTMVLGADTFRTSLYDRYESLVLKYDTTGQLLWSRQIHSEPYTFVVVTSLAVDSSQNVYGAGLSDGNTQVAAPVSAAGGGYRWKHFLFKLDSSGAGRHISKLFSNSCCDKTLFRVATGGYNTVYVAGYFGNANTDSLKLGSSALITTAPGTSDLFLARYDTTCNLLWARNAAGTGNDYLYGLAADSRGRAYIAGSFYSTTIAFGTHLLYRKDTFSACFAACDSNGVFVYARGADGGGNNSVAGITCRNTGEVYVAGNFNDSIRLGIWGHHLPTGGENAFFWAQYHETGLDGVTRVGSSTISLWPNPCNTQGILHLSAQVQQAVLTDVAGKVVANWRQTALLQLPALLPGVYLLKATVDNITWNSVLVHVE